MRLTNNLVAAAAVLGFAAAAMTPLEAMSHYPSCAQKCMMEFVPKSVCQLTDVDCLCNNGPLNDNLATCIHHGCLVTDALKAKNTSATFCGLPTRDASAVSALIGVIGGGVALLVFVGRIISVLTSQGRSLGWDDWTIAITMALTVPPTVFAVPLSQNGLGRDIWTLTPDEIKNILFYYFMGEIFYLSALAMNKISILCFLLRVFPAKEFRRVVYVVMGLCAGYGIAFVFATVFQCSPIPYAWRQVEDPLGGRCNNINLQGWTSAVFNIALDLVVLALPLKNLYKLQMSLRKKLMIMVMFSLGIFVTIVSIVRLRSMIRFANSQNITWDYMDIAYWSTIELHVGIVCACLPSLRSLFVALGAKVLATTRNGSRGSRATGPHSAGSSKNSTVAEKARGRGGEGDFVPLVDVEIGHVRPLDSDSVRRLAPLAPNRIRATTSILRTSDSDDGLPPR